jgi:hypothetical protein
MGVHVHDAHSSMALGRRALDAVVPHVLADSALIPAEILVRAAAAGLTIREIEVEHHPRRAGGQTGATPGELLRVQLGSGAGYAVATGHFRGELLTFKPR